MPTITPGKDTVSPPEDETPSTDSDASLRNAGDTFLWWCRSVHAGVSDGCTPGTPQHLR